MRKRIRRTTEDEWNTDLSERRRKRCPILRDVDDGVERPHAPPLCRFDDKPTMRESSAPSNSLEEQGDGSPTSPYRLPLRSGPNQSGCVFCPTKVCHCSYFFQFLKECYDAIPLKRISLRYRQPALCAKSVLPSFVSRMIRLGNITEKNLFVDLGCGNGSVVLQVAAETGARCIGVELDEHNATVARRAVEYARPKLEERFNHPLNVSIIHADLCHWLKEEGNPVFSSDPPTCVIWAANLLMPKPVNHFLSETLRAISPGSRVFCFEDLYPHSRSVAKIRDPDAFSRFIMKDYMWQLSSVEWCDVEGKFFSYTRV